MKTAQFFLALAALAGFSGCGQVDLAPEGDPARVLNGQVSVGDAGTLPPDAVVTVRVVDANTSGMPARVLGSQTVTNPGSFPVAFRVEYRAEDELLRLGLNIDVRVSFAGRVQYYNRNRYAVSTANASDVHRINVDRSGP
jgi:uncharacterized lipoprotein YbaY